MIGALVKLPLRVRSRVGETALGLLARLSTRHSETDAATFASSLGLDLRRVARGHEVALIATLAGHRPEVLARYSPMINSRARTVMLNGETVHLGDWSCRTRRWCPVCFHDDITQAERAGERTASAVFHRFWWDVRSIAACPVHRMPLIDTCPECMATIGWSGPALNVCPCGGELSSKHSPVLSQEDVAADHYLLARLTGTLHQGASFIDALSFKEAVTTLERLGQASLGGWSRRKARLSASAAVEARNEGLKIIVEWPEHFWDSLNRIASTAEQRKAPAGLIGTYGWLYEYWIGNLPDIGPLDEIRRVMRAHAVQRGVIADGELALGGRARDTITLMKAASLLGVGHARMRQLAEAEGMIPTGTRRSVATPLTISAVTALRSSLERSVGSKGLQQLLGIGKKQTQRLVAAGLIAPTWTNGAAKQFRRFSVAGVEHFLAKLGSSAPPLRRAPPGAMPLPTACQNAGVRLEDACRALLSRTIRALGVLPGKRSVPQIVIRPSALRALRARPEGLTVEQLAEELGVHPEVARHLVSRRLIACRGEGVRRRIAHDGVVTFKASYMSGVEVAGQLRTSPRMVLRLLTDLGLEPAFGPPECRQVFYLRYRALEAVRQLQLAQALESVHQRATGSSESTSSPITRPGKDSQGKGRGRRRHNISKSAAPRTATARRTRLRAV